MQYTGPILTFTASGHLPERSHFFLYLSHFLLQDSCKFPSNFLVQYGRISYRIYFTSYPCGLGISWYHTMMNYLDFLWYFKPQKRLGNLNFSYLSDIPYDAMQMTFHAHVLSAVLMRFWGVACVWICLIHHISYTMHISLPYTMYITPVHTR